MGGDIWGSRYYFIKDKKLSPLEMTHINKRETVDDPIAAKTQRKSIKF